MKRLLVLSCSALKKSGKQIKAIDIYNGPPFKVLRHHILNYPASEKLDVFILSAKYGLISGGELIDSYDQRMTKERAMELNSSTIEKLEKLFENEYDDIFMLLTKDYLKAINGLNIQKYSNLTLAKGKFGEKLAHLSDWLKQKDYNLRKKNIIKAKYQGKSVLKGVELELTSDQVLEKAKHEMKVDQKYSNCYSWYVSIDSQKVSPKWIVSKITGISVRDFETKDALRVLVQLGVKVENN